mmetsp:Transcript_28679/g.62818  ORF Transcript_28679/g.62818 Transcript_28679/m.62818 type:complete len:208 (+) Transcript_28679:489-1112(+)
MRVCSVIRPRRTPSSTTGRKVTGLGSSITCMASTAFMLGSTVRGFLIMMSEIFMSSTLAPWLASWRRRSPSVKTPPSLPSPSTTSRHPHPFAERFTSSVIRVESGLHVGRSFATFITSPTFRIKRFPMRPAGWFMAYSSMVSFLACMIATAQVSPKSIWMAVEVTGARSKGQSSRIRGRCTSMSHAFASLHPGWEWMPTSLAPFALA